MLVPSKFMHFGLQNRFSCKARQQASFLFGTRGRSLHVHICRRERDSESESARSLYMYRCAWIYMYMCVWVRMVRRSELQLRIRKNRKMFDKIYLCACVCRKKSPKQAFMGETSNAHTLTRIYIIQCDDSRTGQFGWYFFVGGILFLGFYFRVCSFFAAHLLRVCINEWTKWMNFVCVCPQFLKFWLLLLLLL